MINDARDRIYLAVIAGLLFVIAAMAYKFIIAGSTEPTADGRNIGLGPIRSEPVLAPGLSISVLTSIQDSSSPGDARVLEQDYWVAKIYWN